MKMFTKKEMAAITLLETLLIINVASRGAPQVEGLISLFFMMLGPVLLVLASRLFV